MVLPAEAAPWSQEMPWPSAGDGLGLLPDCWLPPPWPDGDFPPPTGSIDPAVVSEPSVSDGGDGEAMATGDPAGWLDPITGSDRPTGGLDPWSDGVPTADPADSEPGNGGSPGASWIDPMLETLDSPWIRRWLDGAGQSDENAWSEPTVAECAPADPTGWMRWDGVSESVEGWWDESWWQIAGAADDGVADDGELFSGLNPDELGDAAADPDWFAWNFTAFDESGYGKPFAFAIPGMWMRDDQSSADAGWSPDTSSSEWWPEFYAEPDLWSSQFQLEVCDGYPVVAWDEWSEPWDLEDPLDVTCDISLDPPALPVMPLVAMSDLRVQSLVSDSGLATYYYTSDPAGQWLDVMVVAAYDDPVIAQFVQDYGSDGSYAIADTGWGWMIPGFPAKLAPPLPQPDSSPDSSFEDAQPPEVCGGDLDQGGGLEPEVEQPAEMPWDGPGSDLSDASIWQPKPRPILILAPDGSGGDGAGDDSWWRFPRTSDGGSPDGDVSDVAVDPLYRVYLGFLRENPQWPEMYGVGGVEPQVVTASSHLPWIDFGTPARARAFDAWFERNLMLADGPGADPDSGMLWQPPSRPVPIALADSEVPGEDPAYSAYLAFLRDNPRWPDRHGAGGIQLDVITASSHLPWVEFGTPGLARAFDVWFERNVMAVRGRGGAISAGPGADAAEAAVSEPPDASVVPWVSARSRLPDAVVETSQAGRERSRWAAAPFTADPLAASSLPIPRGRVPFSGGAFSGRALARIPQVAGARSALLAADRSQASDPASEEASPLRLSRAPQEPPSRTQQALDVAADGVILSPDSEPAEGPSDSAGSSVTEISLAAIAEAVTAGLEDDPLAASFGPDGTALSSEEAEALLHQLKLTALPPWLLRSARFLP